MPAEIRIGTSGWHYKHWKGPFYPPDLPASKMLEYYLRHFDTVEINNTFYRLPSETALATWRDSTPATFRFAVKGSRYLTHMKKLSDPEAGLEKFLSCAKILGHKLGPILFQLPPFLDAKPERLDAFLAALPRSLRCAFEFRHPGWHNPAIYDLLRSYNAAFCIFDIAGFQSPIEVTADFAYVRLHGPGGRYQGSYSHASLERWAEHIRAWRKRLKAVYVYFDNDQTGYAPQNALELKRLL
ncbi:MAG: hypothetical protein JWO48_3430 [Bryobacterales bacterium]|nr:hypothetical protein [Bryobacterales bacterium]